MSGVEYLSELVPQVTYNSLVLLGFDMSAAETFKAIVNQDGDVTLLGRVCFRDATGATSPSPCEGKLVQQADLSSITVELFDLDGADPDTADQTSTPTIADVIFNTLQTSDIWTNVSGGGNFLFDVPASWLTTGSRNYLVQAKFTNTGGKVGFGKWKLVTREVRGS